MNITSCEIINTALKFYKLRGLPLTVQVSRLHELYRQRALTYEESVAFVACVRELETVCKLVLDNIESN